MIFIILDKKKNNNNRNKKKIKKFFSFEHPLPTHIVPSVGETPLDHDLQDSRFKKKKKKKKGKKIKQNFPS